MNEARQLSLDDELERKNTQYLKFLILSGIPIDNLLVKHIDEFWYKPLYITRAECGCYYFVCAHSGHFKSFLVGGDHSNCSYIGVRGSLRVMDLRESGGPISSPSFLGVFRDSGS